MMSVLTKVYKFLSRKLQNSHPMKKCICCILISVCFLISCSSGDDDNYIPKGSWHETDNSASFWAPIDDSCFVFSWSGTIIAGLADGIGIMKIQDTQTGDVQNYKLEMDMGSPKSEYWKKCKSMSFLGNGENNKAEGFGVLKIGNLVYVGEFKNGKIIESNGVCIFDKKIVYSGIVYKTTIANGIEWEEDADFEIKEHKRLMEVQKKIEEEMEEQQREKRNNALEYLFKFIVFDILL